MKMIIATDERTEECKKNLKKRIPVYKEIVVLRRWESEIWNLVLSNELVEVEFWIAFQIFHGDNSTVVNSFDKTKFSSSKTENIPPGVCDGLRGTMLCRWAIKNFMHVVLRRDSPYWFLTGAVFGKEDSVGDRNNSVAMEASNAKQRWARLLLIVCQISLSFWLRALWMLQFTPRCLYGFWRTIE